MEIAITMTLLAGSAAWWRVRTVGRAAIWGWIKQQAERRERAWLAWEREMWGE